MEIYWIVNQRGLQGEVKIYCDEEWDAELKDLTFLITVIYNYECIFDDLITSWKCFMIKREKSFQNFVHVKIFIL